MSENTPDTNMDTSDMTTDFTNGENEPSMEDILASIRQIIADDQVDDVVSFDDLDSGALTLVNETTDTTAALSSGIALEVVESQAGASPQTGGSPLSGSSEETDIIDLINFVDESLESDVAESDVTDPVLELDIVSAAPISTPVFEAADDKTDGFDELEDLVKSLNAETSTAIAPETVTLVQETVAPNPIAFDEGLDLIVSEDATDFVTTTFDANPPLATRESRVDEFEDLVIETPENVSKEGVENIEESVSLGSSLDVETEFEDLVPEEDELAIPEVSGLETKLDTYANTDSVSKVEAPETSVTPDADVSVFEAAIEENLDLVMTPPTSPSTDFKEIDTGLENMDLVFVEPDDPNFPDVFKADGVETESVKPADVGAEIGTNPILEDSLADDAQEVGRVSEENVMRATPDEDMDLVKSLLADLMDEPSETNVEAEIQLDKSPPDFLDDAFPLDTEVEDVATITATESETAETETSTNILDDVLQRSIEDEVALHAEFETLQQEDQIENASEREDEAALLESEQVESGLELAELDEDESLSAIVAEAEKISAERLEADIGESETRLDDVVAFKPVEIGRKLSLSAKTGAGLAVVGAGAVAFLNTDTPTEMKAAPEVETTAQAPETDQTPSNKPETSNKSEEAETMAQAAKTETLIDDGTHKESTDAFASLTSAVKDKAEMEERGPAIGDLVQDALRPMLKEWLDKNLKGIVERAVTKEVKRISSGK